MHFVSVEPDSKNQKRESWYCMHFKKDFFEVLTEHGKLPEPTLDDYLKLSAELESLKLKQQEM